MLGIQPNFILYPQKIFTNYLELPFSADSFSRLSRLLFLFELAADSQLFSGHQ